MKKEGPLSTLLSGLRTLELLFVEESVTVDVIREQLQVSRSSAYRLLRTLLEAGWITETSRGVYALDQHLPVSLGATRMPALQDLTSSHLRDLSDMFNETVTLSVRSGMSRFAIAQVVPDREVVMRVELGRSWPLHAGATGRAILAALAPRQRRAFLDQLELTPLTAATVIDRQQLETLLAAVSAKGYSVAVGERDPDAFGISAPIKVSQSPVGAITVCGPASRFSQELADRAGPELSRRVDVISHALEESRHSDITPSRTRP